MKYITTWTCENCGHQKQMEYNTEDFTNDSFNKFKNFSKHLCTKCNHVSMKITNYKVIA